MIELTPEQRLAIERQNGDPVRVVDPATQDAYVVVRADVYERLAHAARHPTQEPLPDIPLILLRSQAAYWNNLTGLLKKRRNWGKWVAYHAEECLGIERHAEALIRECIRRAIGEDEYYIDVIEPKAYPPWYVEEIEFGRAEFDEEPPSLTP